MAVYIKLDAYLKNLEVSQRAKPEADRRPVPNLTELAKAVGVTRAHMAKLAKNDVKSLNLTLADKIITAMRERGFPMELTDLLEYGN